MTVTIWLIKAILSHLLTDFILQPGKWIEDRKTYHFASSRLYMHGILTGIVVWIFLGLTYWLTALVILVTHTIIDGWKSYRKESITYFLLDQILHLLVIVGCWYFIFKDWHSIPMFINRLNSDRRLWMIVTAAVFLTTPSGILIGKLTSQWRDKINDAESLANAGKWIGIIERLIVLALVLQNQYPAISLLVAAKGIIRFSEIRLGGFTEANKKTL